MENAAPTEDVAAIAKVENVEEKEEEMQAGATEEKVEEEEEDEDDSPNKHILAHKTAIVKVFATTQAWDHDCPWQALSIQTASGSGVVIAGGRILTVAHVVANQTFCQIQRCGIPDKHQAKVLFVSHECDLALLEPEDPSLFADITPLEMGELPDLRDQVYVCGFPVGGDEISISEGVVSRIEIQVLLPRTVLVCGGPCIKDGKIVGLAFQGMDNIDNVGEVVPTLVIHHFLEGVRRAQEDGVKYQGFPALGVVIQGILNPLLRQSLGMQGKESGVLVTKVMYGNSAYGHIEAGDVILEIDGVKVFNNGTVSLKINPTSKHKYRTWYGILLHSRHVGDEISLLVRRKSAGYALQSVKFPLLPLTMLVPTPTYDVPPSYFLYCGLLFQPLSKDYLTTWSNWRKNAPKEYVHFYECGIPEKDRTQVVVLTKILADRINVGYDDDGAYTNSSVTSCNGVPIRNLQHLVDEIITLVTSENGVVVLPAPKHKTAEEAKERILRVYKIQQDRSADLLAAPPSSPPPSSPQA
ncbi:trypsin domain containing protein [Acanthamoeba castellanii str. Neff]|uniref:Trypsin domain containing protein n=1 Tax=Acanthamoeba castellanii (strain ATCC 30010 / Neff) TaxID=1257118 RepID=L8GYE7_ACACF|nr:trypsin domain containing protein [Acanthamoeba castellanii str. Neff]ELR17558.1 trypsin domain containing protein [Acanthamoeba castellanii str. Neff]